MSYERVVGRIDDVMTAVQQDFIMAPSRTATTISASASDVSDNEDIAPEAIALSDSKKHAKRLNDIQRAAEDDAKRRRKERNRRRDENLKKRAQETRGDDKNRNERRLQREKTNENEDEEARNLEARMQRAMQEADAEQEQEQGDEKESWENLKDQQDSEVGVGTGSDSDSSDHPSEGNGLSSDESMCGIEERGMGEGPSDAGPSNDPVRDYLPDHLFSEALSKKAATQPKKYSSLDEQSLQTKSNQKRKPAKKRETKDIVLGSKTIRTISSKSSSVSLAAYGTLPPGKIKRFYESHLNLRSNHASGKRGSSWGRKAANIGVLRSSSTSPAAHFVRNS